LRVIESVRASQRDTFSFVAADGERAIVTLHILAIARPKRGHA
jgi:hypothetical protein